NSHTSSRDTNTQEDVEMTNVEEETERYHKTHGYSYPNEINVETAYQDISMSEDMKTLIELKDTWAKKNHEKFPYINEDISIKESFNLVQNAITSLQQEILQDQVESSQFQERTENIQALIKSFNEIFYKRYIKELEAKHLYNNILNDLKAILLQFRENKLSLNQVDDHLMKKIKDKVDNINNHIRTEFTKMNDCGYKEEFEALRDSLTRFNEIMSLIEKSLKLPQFIAELDKKSNDLLLHYFNDWAIAKEKIGSGYEEENQPIDYLINNLSQEKNKFKALVRIENIKQKVLKKFSDLQNQWNSKLLNYADNEAYSIHLEKANRLINNIGSDLEISFYEGAFKLQTLDENLETILNEITEQEQIVVKHEDNV
ncbi:6470_t:CDS:2, partial [Racocetra fulgida]